MRMLAKTNIQSASRASIGTDCALCQAEASANAALRIAASVASTAFR